MEALNSYTHWNVDQVNLALTSHTHEGWRQINIVSILQAYLTE